MLSDGNSTVSSDSSETVPRYNWRRLFPVLILLSIQTIVLDGRTRTASAKAHPCALVVSYGSVRPEVKNMPIKDVHILERNQYEDALSLEKVIPLPSSCE